MTLRYDDRCKVTAVAPGTAAIPAASPAAVGAFIQMGSITGIANGDTVPYTITDGASLFENGYGTWNSVTGLTRSVVKSNSARTTALINFPAAVTVFCGPIASSVALLNQNGALNLGGNVTLSGFVAVGSAIIGGWNGADELASESGGVSNTISAYNSGASGSAFLSRVDNTSANFLNMCFGTLSIGSMYTDGAGIFLNASNSGLAVTAATVVNVVAGGSGGVALTSGAAAWAAISDYRAKTDYGLFDGGDAATVVRVTPVHMAAMKDKPDALKAMFFAHELQTTVPYVVHGEKDGEEMQRIESTDPLVPILWAALNNALERIEKLEAAAKG